MTTTASDVNPDPSPTVPTDISPDPSLAVSFQSKSPISPTAHSQNIA